MKKNLDELNKKYGFKTEDHIDKDGKLQLHPVYKKWLGATSDIESVYSLAANDQISLGKARELTSAIIEAFLVEKAPTLEEIKAANEAYVAGSPERQREYGMVFRAHQEGINWALKSLLKLTPPSHVALCSIGGPCASRTENNECKSKAYCGYKRHQVNINYSEEK